MATKTTATVQEILQQISDLRGESSTNTSAIRIRAISNAEATFALAHFWRTHLLRDQTVVGSGSNDYTVGSTNNPMRLKGLTEVFVDSTSTPAANRARNGSKYSIVDYNAYKSIISNDSSQRIVYEWYDAVNDLWKMHINPAPASTDTITYSFYWQPPTRTLTTDVVVCPDMDIIVDLALAYIYKGEDEQKYQDHLLLADNGIQELKRIEDTAAVNQLYTMPSIENSNYSRGIGSY